MSNNILLIDGGKKWGEIGGKLSSTLHNFAKEVLSGLGYQIRELVIEKGYDSQNELENIIWADYMIYQMPGWWMGEPWTVKKYIDDVFLLGQGKLYANDGRSHSDPSKKYGSGGLCPDKKYMFSLTWNAPLEAFEDKNQFFEGVGVDGVYLHLHKAHQFLGMSPLPTFICNDVIKNLQLEQYKKDYEQHLKKVFAK